MTEPQLDERTAETDTHPPFRMRSRTRLLMPDFAPPTLAELRWSAQQRRSRRAGRRVVAPILDAPAETITSVVAEVEIPEPEIPPVEDLEPVEEIEPVEDHPVEPPVIASPPPRPVVLEPDPRDGAAGDAPLSFSRLRAPRMPHVVATRPEWLDRGPLIDDPDDIEVPDLEPSLDLDFHPHDPHTLALPAPVADEPEWVDVWADAQPLVTEPEPEPLDLSDDGPPVSHLLVVRDPAGSTPSQIAVLDDPESDTVVLPRQPDRTSTRKRAKPALLPEVEEHYEPAPEVPKVWQGRPAPMYWRVLRLRNVRPNGWLRALFFEGSVALAVVLVLAEAASVWTIVVLPLVVAIIVKANDVVVGSLRRSAEPLMRADDVASERDEELVGS